MPTKFPTAERRENSRQKEKRRNEDINDGFQRLQSSFSAIPFISGKRKVPKVKMLRLAAKYIDHLKRVLSNEQISDSLVHPPRPLDIRDFETIAYEEMNLRNSYTGRLHEAENDPPRPPRREQPFPSSPSPSSSTSSSPTLVPKVEPSYWSSSPVLPPIHKMSPMAHYDSFPPPYHYPHH